MTSTYEVVFNLGSNQGYALNTAARYRLISCRLAKQENI